MLESPAEAQCVWSFANVSAEELARLSSVPRALEFDVDDQDPDVHLSASIPADFRGYVDMAAPQLLVEVSVKKNRSDDDDKSDDDGGGTSDGSSEEDDGIHCFDFITVQRLLAAEK